jgi:hypothetical protein
MKKKGTFQKNLTLVRKGDGVWGLDMEIIGNFGVSFVPKNSKQHQ